MSRSARGALGEARAADYLISCGYRVLDRNWRCRHGELDLVVTKDGVICFVEVRYRGRGARVRAAASIDARKRGRLVRAAQSYLGERGLSGRPARFDVIAIDADSGLTHLEGAFGAAD